MALSGTVGSYQEFNYTGGIQQVTIPVDGIYKLEVYGAQGGGGTFDQQTFTSGGNGGYSVGYKELKRNDKLYICVGGQGGTVAGGGKRARIAGGYNGGGTGFEGGYGAAACGGGGATHIASSNSLLSKLSNNKSSVYIVAGGGGGGFLELRQFSPTGGNGGGVSGNTGACQSGGSGGAGGTQTSGYAFGQGQPSGDNDRRGPGGGGWYGGFCGSSGSGGGGSGYIGGVPSFTYNGTTYAPSTSNGQKGGNGYAKITFVALSKIYKLNVDGSVVQTVYLDGVALEQIKFDGVSVFGNP